MAKMDDCTHGTAVCVYVCVHECVNINLYLVCDDKCLLNDAYIRGRWIIFGVNWLLSAVLAASSTVPSNPLNFVAS